MINPFDRNFFRFIVGFVAILSISFGILFYVSRYTDTGNKQAAATK